MSNDEGQILAAYRQLMMEVQERLETVFGALDGKLALPEISTKEVCFLQLRLVCECISIACVIAHDGMSDINAGKIKKEYAADKMVHMLEKLHDRFYPSPFRVIEVSPGHKHLVDRECDFLQKADLKKVYGKCGEILHRGTPASFLLGRTSTRDWKAEVREYAIKTSNLLAAHATIMKGDERVIFYDGINQQAFAANAIE